VFETLTIESEAVRERRIARRGKLVQRDIPQVTINGSEFRINRSEFLAQQSHDTSPLRFRDIGRRFHSQRVTSQKRSHYGTARTSPSRNKTSHNAASIAGATSEAVQG
jgi:hypothetical protein